MFKVAPVNGPYDLWVLKSDLSSLLGAEEADPDASYEVETN